MRDIERLVLELEGVLVGDLAPFRAGIESCVDGIGLDDLLDDGHIARILAWYDRRLGAKIDWRPALSIWMGWHFQSVLPPLVAAITLLDRCPKLDLEHIAFVVSAEHKVACLGLGPDVDLLPPLLGPSRFEGLVRVYLSPLIAHAAKRTGLTPRVLWSNAGHVLERFVGKLEAELGPRPGVGAARELLAMPAWSDGTANMLHCPVTYVDGRRLRRVCCMRYLFPDGRLCSVCPMLLSRSARQTAHD